MRARSVRESWTKHGTGEAPRRPYHGPPPTNTMTAVRLIDDAWCRSGMLGASGGTGCARSYRDTSALDELRRSATGVGRAGPAARPRAPGYTDWPWRRGQDTPCV